jgi:hypothetical protein
MSYLFDDVMASVRTLLKQASPHFANMSRHDLDVFLGDFERDLGRALDDLDAQNERAIENEIEWAREDWEQERREAVKAAKPKKS